MKKRNDGYSFIIVFLVLAAILSCNFPGFAASDEAANLRETVRVLNTSVAGNEVEQPQGTTPQPALTEEIPTDIVPSPTMEVSPTAIPHTLKPAQPGWVARWFNDTDSSRTSPENRAPGGDTYSKNIFERPFTANDMVFRPDLDINKAEISSDSNFIYFSIYLHGTNPQTSDLPGTYGVELDTDYDGRGNYLILVSKPGGTEWKMENVTAYMDSGKKVGGAHPMSSDAPSDYVGYDQTLFSLENLKDPDAAWGRISPKGSATVELAFKKGLIGGKNSFLWSIWADEGVKDVTKFDYNDHFTQSEAGSPYKDANYPLKSLALIDSTCREIFNFTPTGPIPGICAVPPTITPSPEPTDIPTVPPSPGGITGLVFGDSNNNGSRDSGEGPFCAGMHIIYSAGACGSGIAIASSIPLSGSCTFSVSGLPAGAYCVSASGYQLTTPNLVTVNVPEGGNASVIFGAYAIP